MLMANFAFFLPHGDDDSGPGPLGALLFMVLGPIAASVIHLAISRSRDFEDLGGRKV